MEKIVPKKEFVEDYPVWVGDDARILSSHLSSPPERSGGDDAPIDLKLKILAAIASYQFGVKGIDGMLRKYGEIWRAQLERTGAVTLQ